MTNDQTKVEPVVTQADREAAWPFRAECFGHADKAGWDCGKYDHARSIQAFARHRLAAQAQSEGRQKVEPRPYPHPIGKGTKYSECFGFDDGSLTIRTSGFGEKAGTGWLCFPEKALEQEQDDENGKWYWVANLANSELIFIRDTLNQIFPAALSTVPQQVVGELDWFSDQRQLELFYHTPTYCDDDDQAREWRVVQRSGRINDREWKIVGHGSSATDAVISARAALAGIGAGQEGEGL